MPTPNRTRSDRLTFPGCIELKPIPLPRSGREPVVLAELLFGEPVDVLVDGRGERPCLRLSRAGPGERDLPPGIQDPDLPPVLTPPRVNRVPVGLGVTVHPHAGEPSGCGLRRAIFSRSGSRTESWWIVMFGRIEVIRSRAFSSAAPAISA